MKLNRIYHNYNKWEEYHNGMWAVAESDKKIELLEKAIGFTGNADLYGSYMMRVANEWKYSCEHNLTDMSINRRAWIGHAACCLAIGCPEDITRAAWWHLTKNQQDRANAKADEAIAYWITNHIKSVETQLCLKFI